MEVVEGLKQAEEENGMTGFSHDLHFIFCWEPVFLAGKPDFLSEEREFGWFLKRTAPVSMRV